MGDYKQTNTGDKNYLVHSQKPQAKLSDVEQILLEVKLTDYLQKEVDRCNLYFKNFKLRLIMEEE
jgi:hypothetical protein